VGLNADEIRNRFRAACSSTAGGATLQALRLKTGVVDAEWHCLTNALAREFSALPSSRLSRSERVRLKKLRNRAVFAIDDQIRIFTPAAVSLGHVLGFTRSRDCGHGLQGVTGLESYFNTTLGGAPGVCISQKDATGKELAFRRGQYMPPRPGNHLVLTIDPGLQSLCYKALAEACARHSPSNATAMIIHPQTGEILAWASWPPFNLYQPADSPPESLRNHAIADILELGSVFKLITLAAALNEGLVTLDQMIYAERGIFRCLGAILHDRNPYGQVTIREALMRSVNIVFAKLGIALGPARFQQYITGFGFGRPTGITLPDESAGQIKTNLNWSGFTQTRIPIGHAIGITQLQMTMATAAFARRGQLLQPLLIRRVETPRGEVLHVGQPTGVRQVVKPAVADAVLEAATGVVSPQGTARAAALEAHSVCGKTGTAQLADSQRYLPDCYVASFFGLVPAKDPQLCISVVFNCPRNGHTGAAVAVPVFHEIAQQAVNYLRIPPDKTGKNLLPVAVQKQFANTRQL
jgi:cell division protein FtsI (penicillin-binding protein 3)